VNKVQVLVFVLVMLLNKASAHEVRPVYLEITQLSAQKYRCKLKVPAQGNYRLNITVDFPKNCAIENDFKRVKSDIAFIDYRNIICIDGLEGKTITINGLQSTLTDALVRVVFLNGNVQTSILKPNNAILEITKSPVASGTIQTYFILGIEHILIGIDHLFFVIGLMMITSGFFQLIKTITTFTIAHSITLVSASLGIIHVPVAPVEALSIVFVAREALFPYQNTLAQKSPWLVSLAFGLLHGFGFAGALSETGLPQNSIVSALLFFNLGVETGQILFISIILLFLFLLRKVIKKYPEWLKKIPLYVIGSVAMYWTIERIYSFI
jgi:hydrogenase/urease accessory protein HupE